MKNSWNETYEIMVFPEPAETKEVIVGVTAAGDVRRHCLPSQQFDDAVIYVLASHSFRLPYPRFHLVYVEIL